MAGADSSGMKLDSSVMRVLLARRIGADSDFIVRGGKGIICKVEWGIVRSHPFRRKREKDGAPGICAIPPMRQKEVAWMGHPAGRCWMV